jgi:cytochrome c biogenesis protein CcdA
MEVPNKTSQPVETASPTRRVKWRWRILFIKVWLIAAFLLVIFLGLGVTALMAGADGTLELEQRVYAICVGAIVIFIGLAILKAVIPTKALSALFRKAND